MKNLSPKQREARKVKIPKIVLKQADVSPEEVQQCLEDIYTILFEETLKVFDG